MLSNVSSSPDGVQCLYSFGIYEHLKPYHEKTGAVTAANVAGSCVIRMFLGFTDHSHWFLYIPR